MYSPQAHKNKTQPSAEVCFVTANPTPPYPPTPSYPPPTHAGPRSVLRVCKNVRRSPELLGGEGGGWTREGRCGGPALHRNRLCPRWRVAEALLPHPGGAFGRCEELSHCSRAADLFTLAARRPALPAHLPCAPARSSAICRLNAIVSSHAWRPGRHPRGLGA